MSAPAVDHVTTTPSASASVSRGEPTQNFPRIRSFEVSGGGFLDGVHIDFDPRMNTLIGSRGSAKTTTLESLRYGLKAMPEGEESTAHRRQVERLIAGNLASGRIRIEIETKDGQVYFVERDAHEDSLVLDAEGHPTPITLDHGAFFKIDIYSQNEIERVADSPSLALDLIDKFVAPEIADVNRRLRSVSHDVSANGGEIVRLTKRIGELSEGISELDVIAEKIRGLAIENSDAAEPLNREIGLRALRDREKRVLQGLARKVADGHEGIGKFESWIHSVGHGAITSEIIQGPNGRLFSSLDENLRGSMANLKRLAVSMSEELGRLVGHAQSTEGMLAESHRVQEARYRETLDRHEKEKGRASERSNLERRRNELEEKRRELAEARAALETLRSRRESMLQALAGLRSSRSDFRRSVVARLNERLLPEIRVSLSETGDLSKYRAMLTDALRGSGIRYSKLVNSIVETFHPADLVRAIDRGDAQALADQLDVDAERASKVIEELRGTEAALAIEAVELDDVPRIELRDGPDYKDSTTLSTGQKCTTILPILLLESDRPLLIDQPEDNLDNAFIYETVVRRLREVKTRRQIIFVTHNPNIPVLSDAERVIVMTSTGRNASVLAAGKVDEVRTHVETILEGGEAAFEERRKRYGR